MGIALRGFNLRVPENLLHLVQAAAVVDQQARKAMAQVMYTHFRQAGQLAGGIPRTEYRNIGLARIGVGKHMFCAGYSGDARKQA